MLNEGQGPDLTFWCTPYNGSRLDGKATSGLEGSVPQLLSQLQKAFCFGYFPGYFRQFFMSGTHEDKGQKNEMSGNVHMSKIC